MILVVASWMTDSLNNPATWTALNTLAEFPLDTFFLSTVSSKGRVITCIGQNISRGIQSWQKLGRVNIRSGSIFNLDKRDFSRLDDQRRFSGKVMNHEMKFETHLDASGWIEESGKIKTIATFWFLNLKNDWIGELLKSRSWFLSRYGSAIPIYLSQFFYFYPFQITCCNSMHWDEKTNCLSNQSAY